MRRGALTLLVAVGLTLATVRVERVGAAPNSWRDEMCAPEPHHPCGEGVLQGGAPVVYLLDRPGISVMGKLAFVEDLFRPGAFAVDVAAFWLTLLGLAAIARRQRVTR